MNEHQKATARACLEAAESNSMTFPQIVGTLIDSGFESYTVDFRRSVATYYLPDNDFIELPTHRVDAPIARAFDAGLLQTAIREAQQLVAGYSYKVFCKNAVSAGCTAYMVSFTGRRALYVGRTAETHVEHFPD